MSALARRRVGHPGDTVRLSAATLDDVGRLRQDDEIDVQRNTVDQEAVSTMLVSPGCDLTGNALPVSLNVGSVGSERARSGPGVDHPDRRSDKAQHAAQIHMVDKATDPSPYTIEGHGRH